MNNSWIPVCPLERLERERGVAALVGDTQVALIRTYDDELFADINAWWRGNAEAGRASLLMGYAFGKAQRILAGVDSAIGQIVVHGAVEPRAVRIDRRARHASLERVEHRARGLVPVAAAQRGQERQRRARVAGAR